MPIRPYPIPMDDFRNVLTLSPLSLVEIARRFGISRSNLMGLLGGNRTLSDDRLLQLVKWVGLVGADTLHLTSGIHFWKIASETQMEAFLHLPTGILPESLRWSLVLEFPPLDRDWIHLKADIGEQCWVLLSVRPVFFALLRDRLPGVGRPVTLMYLQKPLKQILADTRNQGLAVAWAKQPQTLTLVDAPMRDTHAADLSVWMAWARQKLAIDTSDISDQIYPPMTESSEDGLDPAIPCDQAWNLLAHRLDVAGAAHPDIVDIPIFPMEQFGQYPSGMVRMDRNWLGDTLLELGKKGRLRCYVRENSTESVIVALSTVTRCGLPPPWVLSTASERYLIWRDPNLEIAAHIESNDYCIGPVVAAWHRATTYMVQ
ncbi:hypothetical protein A6M23_07935 [Acidithiobacillus thiooxidans]|uniref:Uncharacterized protein n=1 Tax=Acidithiobacillus thiooxidans TaxID=930 RepID=A0A1C2IBU8_ACITH|nr:hypothetical protein [Acidithiobacillus thiooxidans]OCX73466.1 hypothetical protein A6M23_07935 [Acidithiobacillus thiooxidans]